MVVASSEFTVLNRHQTTPFSTTDKIGLLLCTHDLNKIPSEKMPSEKQICLYSYTYSTTTITRRVIEYR